MLYGNQPMFILKNLLLPIEKWTGVFDLPIPEDEVAAFPQLFTQVGGSRPVLQSPLLGAGR